MPFYPSSHSPPRDFSQAAIRKELNEFKSTEMEVHASSKHLTRSVLCLCRRVLGVGEIHVRAILGVSGLNIAPCLSSGAGVELKIDGRASGGGRGEGRMLSAPLGIVMRGAMIKCHTVLGKACLEKVGEGTPFWVVTLTQRDDASTCPAPLAPFNTSAKNSPIKVISICGDG